MGRLLLFEFMMLGVGILAPWNTILTAMDWFNTIYPDRNIAFIFTIIIYTPFVFLQPLIIWKGDALSFNLRIAFCFFLTSILLVLCPVLAAFTDPSMGYWLSCILVGLLGIVNCIA